MVVVLLGVWLRLLLLLAPARPVVVVLVVVVRVPPPPLCPLPPADISMAYTCSATAASLSAPRGYPHTSHTARATLLCTEHTEQDHVEEARRWGVCVCVGVAGGVVASVATAVAVAVLVAAAAAVTAAVVGSCCTVVVGADGGVEVAVALWEGV